MHWIYVLTKINLSHHSKNELVKAKRMIRNGEKRNLDQLWEKPHHTLCLGGWITTAVKYFIDFDICLIESVLYGCNICVGCGVTSPKIGNSVIIYSAFWCSKPVWLCFLCRTKKIFFEECPDVSFSCSNNEWWLMSNLERI